MEPWEGAGSLKIVLNPERIPVIVGVGQVTNPGDRSGDLFARPEPLDLMVRALNAAAEDASGAQAGGASKEGRAILDALEALYVIPSFAWHTRNPAALVAERLACNPELLGLAATGGNMPQSLVHSLASQIVAGELSCAAVVGAECMWSRGAMRSVGGSPSWTIQTDPDIPAPTMYSYDQAGSTELEISRGIAMPLEAYPLIEEAVRSRSGRSPAEHQAHLGRLSERMAQVAAKNPYAWIQSAPSAELIATPSESNRMIALPYTKMMTANISVDQGAGYLMCSLAVARSAGVDEDRLIFPLSGADANEHWFLSHREDLGTSPAIRFCAKNALANASLSLDDVDLVDLYSCFPAVVQIACEEIGLDPFDPERPPSLAGGLTFGGGPGNNYVSHSIASMVSRLRERGEGIGLVSGLGWYSTKHAVGLYGTSPQAKADRAFAWTDTQPEVNALPQCAVAATLEGPVAVETYTVSFGREGLPERGIVALRDAKRVRSWGSVTDAEELDRMIHEDYLGVVGSLSDEGLFSPA